MEAVRWLFYSKHITGGNSKQLNGLCHAVGTKTHQLEQLHFQGEKHQEL